MRLIQKIIQRHLKLVIGCAVDGIASHSCKLVTHIGCMFDVAVACVVVVLYMGDYKHWTQDPRTRDPRTGGRGPKNWGSSSVPLQKLHS